MNPIILKTVERVAKMTGAKVSLQAQDQLFLEKFAEEIITKCAIIASGCEARGTENIGAEILEHYNID